MRPLPVTKSRASDFSAICAVGGKKLQDVQNALARSTERFLRLEQLSAFLSSHLDEKSAVALARVALSLRRFIDKTGCTPAMAFASLREGLKDFGWAEAQMATWDTVSGPLRAIVEDQNIEFATKASDLYYRNAYHIHEMRVVTDIRPVLSEERDRIDGAIIRNTFFLTYSDGDENEKVLELAIARGEMERLRDELDRALKKTVLIDTTIKAALALPSIVYDKEW